MGKRHVLLQIHLAAKLFEAIFTRVLERVGEVDAFNVVDQVVPSRTRFLAYGALEHVALCIKDCVLFEHDFS